MVPFSQTAQTVDGSWSGDFDVGMSLRGANNAGCRQLAIWAVGANISQVLTEGHHAAAHATPQELEPAGALVAGATTKMTGRH